MDVRETPAWRKAIGLAHEVCATLEGAAELPGDSGQRLRRAALAVPSLVADAFLDTGPADCRERLSAAAARVAELRQLLRAPEIRKFVPGPEADALLAEAESLALEIRALGGRCPEA
jgi:four helix bundle protein